MASVVLEHVDKVYEGGFRAVNDFNLTIADGEFVVLVGPSGCGKSTTLRMIAGLEAITAGTVAIDGKVVNDVLARDRDIAMVFQSYALYPHLSVYENVAFGLTMRRVPKATVAEKVRRTAETLGITNLLDRRPKQLSGGQRQRVALGRAIVRDPKCFLFDEPLSNLDAKLRVEMRAELKRLHLDLETTTIYVTHDQEEAITLGDRVVVMNEGVIQQCADALTIYHHPVNRFVAGFLGNPPMNFLEGRLTADAGGLRFTAGEDQLAVPDWAQGPLAERVGEQVVLGVRPEGLGLASPAEGTRTDTLAMRVTLVQPLGDRMNIHLATDDHPRLVAQIDTARRVAVGEQVPVRFDPRRLHFFAPGPDGPNLAANPNYLGS